MRLKNSLLLYPILGITLLSCIQDEKPNSEADIETCTVVSPEGIVNDLLIENNRNPKILIYVNKGSDVTQMKLDFTLTPGATIEPVNGTIRDFTTPKQYTVTSEDRQWQKTYIVEVSTDIINIPTEFHFENTELVDDKFEVFYELLPSGTKLFIWASGNGGYAIIAADKKPYEYPTTLYDDGKSGKCAKLETLSTGKLGSLASMPIAAGNLFIGRFETKNAMFKPLEATLFGGNFNFMPTTLTGYYQYKAGDVFTEKDGKVNPDMKDNFDIYAIIYETDSNFPYLDGTDQLTSPRLISVARIKDSDKKNTSQWTSFNIPFELKQGKNIDKEKLANGGYKISIVFSSSIYGDQFRGAVGSTLLIDEVKLITEK